MRLPLSIAAGIALLSTGLAMAKDRMVITSEWGSLTAELAGNAAAKALAQRLPLTLAMRDHLRQEKTGALPAPLPEAARQLDFSVGTLGLWGPDDFVIYYRSGRVPLAGIVVLGKVTGDVGIFDRPGPISVQLRLATDGASAP
jgi:hypothetical protein